MPLVISVLLSIFVILFSGCASITFLPTDESVKYTPTNFVKVYWKNPQKPHTTIGRVTVKSGSYSEETLFTKLKEKAMKVGAHAIIMTGTSEHSSVIGVPSYGGGTTIIPVSSTRLDAIAIRFK